MLRITMACILILALAQLLSAAPAPRKPAWVAAGKAVKESEIPPEDDAYLADWVRRNSMPAQDYIISLFGKRQVVILGEAHNAREHKEFLIALLPRLYHEAKVRCIGWEFSQHADNQRLNRLVTSEAFDRDKALQFARDQIVGLWNSKEHWDVIEAVWRLNHQLKPGQEPMRLIGLNALALPEGIETRDAAEEAWQAVGLRHDVTMAEQVEKEIVRKGCKGLVFVGRCHDFTHHQFPPDVNMGRPIMGNLLYKKFGERVFQVWLNSGESRVIERVMALRGDKPLGFDLYKSPFANVLTPGGWDAPHVPFSKVARGYVFLAPVAKLHPNTPIFGFATEETLRKNKAFYEADMGRTFKNAQELDAHLRAHFSKPAPWYE